jgi:hypothetical protein
MLTRTDYELLVYTLPSRYPAIRLSTLVLAPPGLDTARLTGLVAFDDDLMLASTHPHHKHIFPDIKHHRVPAPGLSFDRPNLPVLIAEIERELLSL